MSEEAVRQTRSQKRALERDHAVLAGSLGDMDSKRVKLERGDAPLALVGSGGDGVKLKSEQAAKVAASILKTGEVKATIKVEVQTGDEPVDMSTSKRWDKEKITGYYSWSNVNRALWWTGAENLLVIRNILLFSLPYTVLLVYELDRN